MKKTFGIAFALIMVALFTVAPTSPATAYPGGIHLHIAGKVGQKAVGSTIFFGAEGLTEAPQAGSGMTPNACLSIRQSIRQNGPRTYPLSQPVEGWARCDGSLWGKDGKSFQIPSSGSLAGQIPLPDLPPGQYSLYFEVWPMSLSSEGTANSVNLNFLFTIGADGTFTQIGPACNGVILGGLCTPNILIPTSPQNIF